MRSLLLLCCVLGLASCSSVRKTGDEQTDKVLAHMSQEPIIVGKDWDQKFLKDGFINGEYVAIGSSSGANFNSTVSHMKFHAETVATANLLKSAPTDFKKIVQRSLNTVNGNDGSAELAQIEITEVKALVGMASNFDDSMCVKTAYPNQDLKYDYKTECRTIVRIPASKLMEAYSFTLDRKYSIQQQSELKKILQQELMSPVKQMPVTSAVGQ